MMTTMTMTTMTARKLASVGAVLLMAAGCCKAQTAAVQSAPAEKAASAQSAQKAEKPASQQAAEAPEVRLSTSPMVPFTVTASRDGEVTPGQVVPLRFTLRSSMPTTSVKTTVRALDGVQISGTLAVDHGRPERDQALRHAVSVRADAGVAGFVVVDIAWLGPAGNGSTTVGVEIRAQGAVRKLKTLGRIEQDRNGNKVEVMPAEMR